MSLTPSPLQRNLWSSKWTSTIPTQAARRARLRARMWTSESLWWRPVNSPRGTLRSRLKGKPAALQKVWKNFHATNQRQRWLVHAVRSPERPSAMCKGAMSLRRMMKLNNEGTSLNMDAFPVSQWYVVLCFSRDRNCSLAEFFFSSLKINVVPPPPVVSIYMPALFVSSKYIQMDNVHV